MHPEPGTTATADLALDPGELARAAARLRSAAEACLADAGGDAPAGDLGAAAVLVSAAVGVHTRAAAQLSAETRLVAHAVSRCAEAITATDAAQAVDLLRAGVR